MVLSQEPEVCGSNTEFQEKREIPITITGSPLCTFLATKPKTQGQESHAFLLVLRDSDSQPGSHLERGILLPRICPGHQHVPPESCPASVQLSLHTAEDRARGNGSVHNCPRHGVCLYHEGLKSAWETCIIKKKPQNSCLVFNVLRPKTTYLLITVLHKLFEVPSHVRTLGRSWLNISDINHDTLASLCGLTKKLLTPCLKEMEENHLEPDNSGSKVCLG